MEHATQNAPAVETLVIEPRSGWIGIDWAELWRYRELLVFFAWRDVKVRYKQSVLGGLWAIIDPLAQMILYTVFFGQVAKMSSEGVPYMLFTLAAIVPFNFFLQGLTRTAGSLVNNAMLVKKIYFPRLIVPTSTLLAGLVDFVIQFMILLISLLVMGFYPNVNYLWLPLLLLITFATGLGLGLFMAALHVQFRDVGFLVPFLAKILPFICFVPFTTSVVPEAYRSWLGFNPMIAVVDGFRYCMLGVGTNPAELIWPASLVSGLLLLTGLFFFRRMEKTFADVT